LIQTAVKSPVLRENSAPIYFIGFLRSLAPCFRHENPARGTGHTVSQSARLDTVQPVGRDPIRILALRQQLVVYQRRPKKPVMRNRDRVHQGLNGIPDPDPALTGAKRSGSRLVAIPVLNGLHHDYRLAA
jgi:hypothetical protein